MKNPRLFRTGLVILLVTLVGLAVALHDLRGARAAYDTQLVSTLEGTVARAAGRLQRCTLRVEETVARLASLVEQGSPPQGALEEILGQVKPARALGYGVSERGAEAQGVVVIRDSSREGVRAGALADVGLTLQAVAGWQEPTAQADGRTLVVRLQVPCRKGQAVVFCDLDARCFDDAIEHVDVGENGINLIFTQKGALLYSPAREEALSGQTLRDMLDSDAFSFFPQMKQFRPGSTGVIRGDGRFVAASNVVEGAGWTICAVCDTRAEERRRVEGQHELLVVLTAVAASIALLFSAFALAWKEGKTLPWVLSGLTSVVFITGTVMVWRLIVGGYLGLDQKIEDPATTGYATPPIIDQNARHRFEREWQDFCKGMQRPDPAFIPTGLWLNTLQFSTAQNVQVTGYVWQRFPEGTTVYTPTFGDAVDASFTQEYASKHGNHRVVRWRFSATLREEFDHSRYPFDHARLRLSIGSPAPYAENVLLVPDISSYTSFRPGSQPGLRWDVVLAGWSAGRTWFDYRMRYYATDFAEDIPLGSPKPELTFNVELQRDFVHAFVLNLMPIIVIACLLFALIMGISGDPDVTSRLGVNTNAVLGTCSGLLFSTILAHTRVRTDFAGQSGFIYLEYYYFLLYMLITALPAYAFLTVSERPLVWLRAENALLPRTLFWPLVSGVVFVVTICFS